MIDTLLVLAITLPMVVAIYGWKYFDAGSGLFAGPADFLISWILPAIAVIAFWFYRQATPGKSALSLRVLDADTGERLSLGQAVGRYLGYFVSIIPLCIGLTGWRSTVASRGGTTSLQGPSLSGQKVAGPAGQVRARPVDGRRVRNSIASASVRVRAKGGRLERTTLP